MGTALQIWRLCWKGQSMLQPGELSPQATPSAQVLTADPVQTCRLQAAGCRQQRTLPLGQIRCRGMLGARACKCTTWWNSHSALLIKQHCSCAITPATVLQGRMHVHD